MKSVNECHSGRGSVVLAGLVALSAAAGCGAPPGGGDPSGVEATQGALVDTFDGREWKSFGTVPVLSTGTGDPGMCTPNGAHSKIIFTRDTSSFIQGTADVVGITGPWGKYGGSGANRKFGGRPACGFLAGTTSPYSFLIFAKGSVGPTGATDKHLFWSKGQWTVNGSAPPPTTALTQWTQLDATTYNTNGNPTVGTDTNGNVVVVYLNDSGQLRANYWTGSGMSGTVNGPALPTGWTGQGSPSIAYVETWVGKFTIFVRATNSSGTARLYKVFFSSDHFVDAAGGPNPPFVQVTLPASTPAIQGDPAMEWDGNLFASTLYFRNGTKLYQMSSNDINFDTSTVKQVTAGPGTATKAVSGNQVVIGGVPYEQGRHWIATRGSGTDNNLYFVESFNDENMVPN